MKRDRQKRQMERKGSITKTEERQGETCGMRATPEIKACVRKLSTKSQNGYKSNEETSGHMTMMMANK